MSVSLRRSLAPIALLKSTQGKRPESSGIEEGAGRSVGLQASLCTCCEHQRCLIPIPLSAQPLSPVPFSVFPFLTVSIPAPDITLGFPSQCFSGIRLPPFLTVPRTSAVFPGLCEPTQRPVLTLPSSGRSCFPRSASPCSPTSHSYTKLGEPAKSESPVTTRILYLPISAVPLEGPGRKAALKGSERLPSRDPHLD